MNNKELIKRMTSKQRFEAALSGKAVDRPCAASITSVINFELMDLVGQHFPDANTEPEPMAELAAGAHDLMGFDSVMPIFGIAQEATALGCVVDFSDPGNLPTPQFAPWQDANAELCLPDGFPDSFFEDKYIKCSLEAIRMLKKHFGDKVMILGKVMGPWTLSYHVYNVQAFLMDTLAKPERVRKSLDLLSQVPILFAKAQLEAGADAIVWADHATGDLIRNTMYRDFLLWRHQELVPQIPAPVILHCCGRSMDRIEFFRETGFDMYHFESANPVEKMVEAAKGKIRLAGNINNPQTLLQKSPDEVRIEVQRVIDAGVDIIAPECAVPLQTPVNNLKTIVEVCQNN
ncbi:MAG: uroporphyrinogen decarboxylase family protein [SAR324 cluster bacterium]|jgi:[methyl-Co(III) methanol-specific corrinoid protein]:coenzyme M methyltransferase|nr:uroporphyrinogen decarboxylase family protein [SAR324 cluster bacterium]MEE1574928.1 uroporphyrinogen decarboxylase family protein [Deltaproteobacteria bacterium]MDP6246450.1 uroporphyrinogen decarboxylase family protein [SAR324 cluster bacterium]MDP6463594.1 uroporphyrinogen decarboxylase family protein [SAR324 cluster bacterium]MDP7139900.1 uroporphyrinogen decarboxylase family protein [SAR324 cluster bacterium]|tara:strand:+ start:6006 stop:7043 length:1038 start_codon:yes stop_codon:yes gene_type:complete